MLDIIYEVSVADLEGAMKKQNISLQAGDAVIINTGWGKLWGKDNNRYRSGNPGLRRQGRRVADRQGSHDARRRHGEAGCPIPTSSFRCLCTRSRWW
jgi:hypothetical protein